MKKSLLFVFLPIWSLCTIQAQAVKVEQTKSILTSSVSSSDATPAEELFKVVEPLTSDIKWGQLSPYNLQTPSQYPAGCVATAMATVMKFHEWPQKGVGNHSYTWKNILLSADFSKATYSWDKMPSDYTAEKDEDDKTLLEYQAEIAQLLSHCGIAVDMDYGDTSISSLLRASKALPAYFGYDYDIQLLQEDKLDDDTRAEWANIIRKELEAGRPVIFGGKSEEGTAHAFVIDGCNAEGKFHINWGWEGDNSGDDGYYDLNNLNPSGKNYSFSCQEMLYNIKKAENMNEVPSDIEFSPVILSDQAGGVGLVTDAENIVLDKEFRVQARTVYYPSSSKSEKDLLLTVALVDKDFKVKYVLDKTYPQKLPLTPGQWMATPYNWYNCVIPSDAKTLAGDPVTIGDGDRICLVAGKEGNWQIVGSKLGDIAYWVKAKNNQLRNYKVKVDQGITLGQGDASADKSAEADKATLTVEYVDPQSAGDHKGSFDTTIFGDRVVFRVRVLNASGADLVNELKKYIVSVRVDGKTLKPWWMGATKNDYAIESLQKDETIVVRAYPVGGSADETNKEVNITTDAAGQLSSKLTTEQRDLASKVKITGPIDATDIAVLNECMNNLHELDLSEATIQAFNIYPSNTIPANAFRNLKKTLTTVILPNTLTSIRANAFGSCQLLENITIPSGVTSIGINAFNGTSSKNVTVLGVEPPSVSWCTFNQTDREKDGSVLYVPEASIAKYQADEEWKKWNKIEAAPKTTCKLRFPNVPFVEFSDPSVKGEIKKAGEISFKAELSDILINSGTSDGWSLEIRVNDTEITPDGKTYTYQVTEDDLVSDVIVEATVVYDLGELAQGKALEIQPGMVVTLTNGALYNGSVIVNSDVEKVCPATTITLRNANIPRMMVRNDVTIKLEGASPNVIGLGGRDTGICIYFNKQVTLSGTGTLSIDHIGGYKTNKGVLNIRHGVGLLCCTGTIEGDKGMESISLENLEVNYIRQFGRKSKKADGTICYVGGWETITLPFTAESVTRANGTPIAWNPKGSGDFFLRQYGENGFENVAVDAKIEGGKPYTILMPDNSFSTSNNEEVDDSKVLIGEDIIFRGPHFIKDGHFTAPKDAEDSNGFVMRPFLPGYQNNVKTRAEAAETFGNYGEYLLDESGENFKKAESGAVPNPFEAFFVATTEKAAEVESFGVYSEKELEDPANKEPIVTPPDNNTPDNNTPDNNEPDNDTPDNNTPDNDTPDNNTPDNDEGDTHPDDGITPPVDDVTPPIIDQDPTGVEDVVAGKALEVYGKLGAIVIKSDKAQTVNIVSLHGYAKVCPISVGTTQVAVPAGIYIVDNKKVIVK